MIHRHTREIIDDVERYGAAVIEIADRTKHLRLIVAVNGKAIGALWISKGGGKESSRRKRQHVRKDLRKMFREQQQIGQ